MYSSLIQDVLFTSPHTNFSELPLSELLRTSPSLPKLHTSLYRHIESLLQLIVLALPQTYFSLDVLKFVLLGTSQSFRLFYFVLRNVFNDLGFSLTCINPLGGFWLNVKLCIKANFCFHSQYFKPNFQS